MKHTMHHIERLPDGQAVAGINPAFSCIKNEIHLGKPSEVCASCHNTFNAVRQPHKEVRLYPINLPIPFAWSYPICRRCSKKLQHGGHGEQSVLAAIESFHYGEKASQ